MVCIWFYCPPLHLLMKCDLSETRGIHTTLKSQHQRCMLNGEVRVTLGTTNKRIRDVLPFLPVLLLRPNPAFATSQSEPEQKQSECSSM